MFSPATSSSRAGRSQKRCIPASVSAPYRKCSLQRRSNGQDYKDDCYCSSLIDLARRPWQATGSYTALIMINSVSINAELQRNDNAMVLHKERIDELNWTWGLSQLAVYCWLSYTGANDMGAGQPRVALR
jgi:hypothetical protein